MSVGPLPEPSEPVAADEDPGLDIDVLRRRRERVFTIGAIVLIVIVTLAAAQLTLRRPPLDRRVLVEAAQQRVRETIGAGDKFDFATPVHVERREPDVYLVRGEVVAVGERLTITHYWYDCLVRREPDGTWRPAQLTLLQQ